MRTNLHLLLRQVNQLATSSPLAMHP